MLKMEPIEFFLRGVPEGFLVILAIYVFSNTPIDKKKYIITSLISVFILVLVKMLPVTYGVHTIINIGLIIVVAVFINKINKIKAIKSALAFTICQFIAEALNLFLIQNVLKQDVEVIFLNPVTKSIYGIPSIIIIFILIISFYIINKKREIA